MTNLKPRYRYGVSVGGEERAALIFLGTVNSWDVYTDDKTYLFITRVHDIPALCRTIEDSELCGRNDVWRNAWTMYCDYQDADPSVSPNARAKAS